MYNLIVCFLHVASKVEQRSSSMDRGISSYGPHAGSAVMECDC